MQVSTTGIGSYPIHGRPSSRHLEIVWAAALGKSFTLQQHVVHCSNTKFSGLSKPSKGEKYKLKKGKTGGPLKYGCVKLKFS